MNEALSQTTSNWLAWAERQLRTAGVQTARLDALVLLCDALGRDKSWVLASPDFVLSTSTIDTLNNYITQRARHIPLAYIRGRCEFYGRDFAVNTNVLVPRPESESLITLLMQYSHNNPARNIIDVGTGSGALSITVKLELPESSVLASDISTECLRIAKANAHSLDATIAFQQSDLLATLAPLPNQTVLLCNLPYVPENYPVNTAATHEPAIALYSGSDGLDHYRKLFEQISQLATKPACVITESLLSQHATLLAIATSSGYSLSNTDGLAQQFLLAE